MLIGNKKTIAFEFIGISNAHATINFYLAGTELTAQDNSHYYSIMITGLKRDLERLQNLDLTLKDKYKILSLPDLFELKEEGVNIHYESIDMDCFYYDLSTTQGSFYLYQHIDDLIIFGKLYDDNIIYCKIAKTEYRQLLQTLLDELIKANPNHPMHK